MKNLLSCTLIVCLMFSILPIGLPSELDKYEAISLQTHQTNSVKVNYSETTIDMSTSCKPVKLLCKLFSFFKTKIKLAEYTTTVSGKLLEVKGTKYRKIITFENDGDPDAGTDNHRYFY